MLKEELFDQLRSLSRAKQWQVIQFLIAELAHTEASGLYTKAETEPMALKEAEAAYNATPDQPLPNQPAIRADRSYTFSDFFALNLPTDKVIGYFGYTYQRIRLALPKTNQPLDRMADLRARLEANLRQVNLTNEAARREFLIAPVLSELLHYTTARVHIEMALYATRQLQGTLDYYLEATHQLLVIEAKNADLQKGFTQLATELIALDQVSAPTPSTDLYGAVSISDVWQFGVLQRQTQQVTQDINLFRVPEDVESLLQVLIAILA